MAPSSRGLGHHPLKVETPVRIRLGLPVKDLVEGGVEVLAPESFDLRQHFRQHT